MKKKLNEMSNAERELTFLIENNRVMIRRRGMEMELARKEIDVLHSTNEKLKNIRDLMGCKNKIIDPTEEEWGKRGVDDAKGLVKVEQDSKPINRAENGQILISLYDFIEGYNCLDKFKKNCKEENQKFVHKAYTYSTGRYEKMLENIDYEEWIYASFNFDESPIHGIKQINKDWIALIKSLKGKNYKVVVGKI